jgi:hypothetical protein
VPPTARDCYHASNVLVANNILKGTSGVGVGLTSTYNVSVVANSMWSVASQYKGALTLESLQMWVSNTHSPMVTNVATTILGNIVQLSSLSRAWGAMVQGTSGWSAPAPTPIAGVDAATLSWDSNCYWKLPLNTIPPLPYASAWYNASNTGFGSLGAPLGFYHSSYGSLSFAAWRARGFDAGHSVYGDPKLTSDGVPGTGSAAAGLGTPAATFIIGVAGADFYGVVRSASGADVVGAVASAGSGPTATASRGPWKVPSATAQNVIAPGACAVAPAPICTPPHCWVPGWHATAPTAFSEASVRASCLNAGAMFPPGGGAGEWSRDVTQAPVHAQSATWITSIGAGEHLHPDFGTKYGGQLNGIPVTYVSSAALFSTSVMFLYAGEVRAAAGWRAPCCCRTARLCVPGTQSG